MVKKQYSEEEIKEVNIPEDKPVSKGHPEDCAGKVVKEFSDQDGDHLHCPICGFWNHPKGEVS